MDYLCDNLRYTFTVGMTVDTLLTLNLAIIADKIIVKNMSCLMENFVLYINFNDILKLSQITKLIHNLELSYPKNCFVRAHIPLSFYKFMNYKGGIHNIWAEDDRLTKEYYEIVTDDKFCDNPKALEEFRALFIKN